MGPLTQVIFGLIIVMLSGTLFIQAVQRRNEPMLIVLATLGSFLTFLAGMMLTLHGLVARTPL